MNPEQPLISIIMPVYNAEKYLREAIDSLLRQTYSNFELIIVNDGSTDGSAEIIEHYKRIDKRLRTYTQKNSGVVMASNFGVSVAKGSYIMRTDADDVSFDNKLLDLVNCALKHPQAIVVSGNIEVINERSEFLYRDVLPPLSEEIKREMFIRNPLPNGATLVKKSAFDTVGGYDNVFAEDFHLWVKLFSKGDFVATGTPLYRWRTNSKGITFSNLHKTLSKEKEYITTLWKDYIPAYVSRSEIKARSRLYISQYKKYGREYNRIFLSDFTRFAVHMAKHGHPALAMRQFIAIAFSSALGFKFAVVRIYFILRGGGEAAMRKVKLRKKANPIPDFD